MPLPAHHEIDALARNEILRLFSPGSNLVEIEVFLIRGYTDETGLIRDVKQLSENAGYYIEKFPIITIYLEEPVFETQSASWMQIVNHYTCEYRMSSLKRLGPLQFHRSVISSYEFPQPEPSTKTPEQLHAEAIEVLRENLANIERMRAQYEPILPIDRHGSIKPLFPFSLFRPQSPPPPPGPPEDQK